VPTGNKFKADCTIEKKKNHKIYTRASAIPPYPMEPPASASFRARNAFRYFVRSYVTRPTTTNAITEIPAKTPKPIGRTEMVFPGSENWVVGVWEDAAAEADADALELEFALSAAAVVDAAALAEAVEVEVPAVVVAAALSAAGAVDVEAGLVILLSPMIENAA